MKNTKKAAVLLTAIVVMFTACGNSKSSSAKEVKQTDSTTSIQTSETTTTTVEETTEQTIPMTEKEKIESVIKDRITSEYDLTDIDKITINDDLGTDTPDDYIALIYLTWNQRNSGKTSKDVLELYSGDLAATLAQECPNVQELAIFWTVPYLDNAKAKCSYERKQKGMYKSDMVWGSAFNK